MPLFDPQTLAGWCDGQWTSLPAGRIDGFSTDTRTLRPGRVFVALRTERRDGHDFLADAAAAGAAGALVSRRDSSVDLPQLVVADPLAAFQRIAREHRRAFRAPVVGISGSAGKTSTKNLLAILLGGQGNRGVLATEGNLNNHLGVPLTLTALDPAEHQYAVVEAGISMPGEMAPLAEMIAPDVAMITIVGPAHLQDLGGLEGVAREKAVLAAAVPPEGVALFPKSCLDHAAFRDLSVRTLTVEEAAVIRPAEPPRDKIFFTITQRGDTTAIALAYGEPPPLVFTLNRVTTGMAHNAVLAICTALWLGLAPEIIQERLPLYSPAPLRGEIRRGDGRLLYLDCYNANPASMSDALETFHALAVPEMPRLYVLGCMEELGTGSAPAHEALGRSLGLRDVDRVVVIGSEAEAVIRGAVSAGARREQLVVAAAAAGIAPRLAEFQGAVFVKGSRRHRLENAVPASELMRS